MVLIILYYDLDYSPCDCLKTEKENVLLVYALIIALLREEELLV